MVCHRALCFIDESVTAAAIKLVIHTLDEKNMRTTNILWLLSYMSKLGGIPVRWKIYIRGGMKAAIVNQKVEKKALFWAGS